MFEFTGRLKTLSIILMGIGVIAIVASFLIGGGSHHEEGHADAAGHEEHAAAQSANEHETHATGEAHHEASVGHEKPVTSGHSEKLEGTDIDIYDKDQSFDYHRTSSRAIPENNHFYQYKDYKGLSAEKLHHQAENKPWANLMVSNFFFLAIALGALFFIAIQYAAQVGWTIVLLRIMEAIASFLWIPVAIMFVLIITGAFHIGGNHIWHWMAEGIMDPASAHYDKIIANKQGYLNNTFFIIRSLIYAIGWIGAFFLLRRMTARMESGEVEAGYQWKKMRNLSAGFLVFYAVTSSTSAWDWIMSIDTHWFSTLFGWYTFATTFVSALTAITLITIYLKNLGFLPDVNRSHIQDMGKFIFAFSIFWTYLWFSQFMLIWYGNIPEEVTYYMARFGEYRYLFFTMLALNFAFPILILMSRDSKRNFGFLLVAGLLVIFGHWLDVFIMVMPGTVGGQWQLGLVQIGTLLGYTGLFIFVVFTALAKRPLMLKKHPMFIESKHHHI